MMKSRTLVLIIIATVLNCIISEARPINKIRAEIVNKTIGEQRDEFKKMDSKTKSRLFRYKIRHDIKEDKNLNKTDIQLLKELRRYLSASFYEDKPEDTKDLIERKIHESGWNEEKIFRYLVTLMTSQEYDAYSVPEKEGR